MKGYRAYLVTLECEEDDTPSYLAKDRVGGEILWTADIDWAIHFPTQKKAEAAARKESPACDGAWLIGVEEVETKHPVRGVPLKVIKRCDE